MAKQGYKGCFDLARYNKGNALLKDTLDESSALPDERKRLLLWGLEGFAAYLAGVIGLPDAERANMLRLIGKGGKGILDAYQAVYPSQDKCRPANMAKPCFSEQRWKLAQQGLAEIIKSIRAEKARDLKKRDSR